MLEIDAQFPQFETGLLWRTLRDFFFNISLVSFSMFVFNDLLNFCSTCHERTSKSCQTDQVWWLAEISAYSSPRMSCPVSWLLLWAIYTPDISSSCVQWHWRLFPAYNNKNSSIFLALLVDFFFLVSMLTPTNFLSLFFHKISNWKWTFLFFVIISAQRWFSKAVGLLRIGELCLSQAGVVFNSLHLSNTGGVPGLCITGENRISLSTTNDHSLIQCCYTLILWN